MNIRIIFNRDCNIPVVVQVVLYTDALGERDNSGISHKRRCFIDSLYSKRHLQLLEVPFSAFRIKIME